MPRGYGYAVLTLAPQLVSFCSVYSIVIVLAKDVGLLFCSYCKKQVFLELWNWLHVHV